MRKVVLYTLQSLDGAVDDPDRFFAQSQERAEVPEFDSAMLDNEQRIIAAQDTVLLGRSMYDQWSRFWPTADYEPFASFINGVKKYVVTSSPLSSTWRNAEAVHAPVEDWVRDLKATPGGDIGVHGSIQLAQSLLAAGLVDELQLVVGPTVGFTGRRLFSSTDDIRRLDLISARPTPSGAVLLTYRMP
ncbi:dihydrofolate reductase family protein [Nostocoides sp. HKS02]|uniref:dihydrofolate reductase family protein n=1 Tax=Nostocoides sp. HKS02 TaxID=1813880 RepID=UPI0012B455DF|nr:dihydrofolate reductase family protein [Tetrasphaera sp. HKS02]QGN59221.1 dihydrofolate reductase [Tetrasphaera sp. HKS02]